jgi:hypothetical protein
MLISFILGRAHAKISTLSLMLWDPQFPIWHTLVLEGYHSLLSSAKCMEDNFNLCNYMYKKYLFRSVNCVHMIYIIYQNNRVNEYERWEMKLLSYEAYIPDDSLQNTAHRTHQIFTTLALLYRSYLLRTNMENEHAQSQLLPGRRKNADTTTHPVEGSEFQSTALFTSISPPNLSLSCFICAYEPYRHTWKT